LRRDQGRIANRDHTVRQDLWSRVEGTATRGRAKSRALQRPLASRRPRYRRRRCWSVTARPHGPDSAQRHPGGFADLWSNNVTKGVFDKKRRVMRPPLLRPAPGMNLAHRGAWRNWLERRYGSFRGVVLQAAPTHSQLRSHIGPSPLSLGECLLIYRICQISTRRIRALHLLLEPAIPNGWPKTPPM
jgi:hypothetical protein